MKYSPAELSYLKESLVQSPPIRPDGRKENQFRPIRAEIDVLPSTNGSAQVRTASGAECIVGIKAKVVRTAAESDLVNVDVEVSGSTQSGSSSASAASLSALFQTAFNATPSLRSALALTSRFSFKLFVDVLVLSNESHPLGLVSFTSYLALLSTKLPLLTSSTDDSKAEEVPVFHDDWDQSIALCGPRQGLSTPYTPPLLFLLCIIGDNVFVDPTVAEERVSATGVLVSWSNGRLSAPLRTVDLGSTEPADVSTNVVVKAMSLVEACATEVVENLNDVARIQA